MARTPVGKTKQPLSDTALFAYVTSRLENVGVAQLRDWARDLGLLAGPDAIRNAPHHAARLARAPDRRNVVRPWALVDYGALELGTVVTRLGVAGRRGALRRIAEVPGVVDVLGIEGGEEALAIAIYEPLGDAEQEDALRARLARIATVVDWHRIDRRRPEAAIDTFRSLTLEAAGRELLRA
jgi:hypothetical protein